MILEYVSVKFTWTEAATCAAEENVVLESGMIASNTVHRWRSRLMLPAKLIKATVQKSSLASCLELE